MKAGYYLDWVNDLTIVYPNGDILLWVYDGRYEDDKFEKVEMSNAKKDFIFLGDL